MKTRHQKILGCVLGLVLVPSVQAAEVTGLRSDIYSSQAAEIFWDKVSGESLSYDVQRDGTLLGSTDGTSFYDASRSPGEVNDYTVTAVDESGVRSTPLTITVGAFGPDSLQPLRLRGDVYSDTAIELFWMRVLDRDLTYEVMRDDGMTGTTKGDSFYDGTRIPGVVNTYSVTAIDEQGARSLPAQITLAAFGTESINSPPATELRASVYSSTAAEILWARVTNRALRYEILRDDGFNAITNGNSFYDNRRQPGVAYTYIVTTIDEEGNRSSPVMIDVPAG